MPERMVYLNAPDPAPRGELELPRAGPGVEQYEAEGIRVRERPKLARSDLSV
jgi:hypothetical protein